MMKKISPDFWILEGWMGGLEEIWKIPDFLFFLEPFPFMQKISLIKKFSTTETNLLHQNEKCYHSFQSIHNTDYILHLHYFFVDYSPPHNYFPYMPHNGSYPWYSFCNI